ncbi:MAG: helix-turn-helix transcriptional regulator [Myxococcota bacterium]
MDTIGAALRRRREERGLTVRDVSEATGVAYSTVAGIERGQNTTMERLEQLFEFYNLRFTPVIESADQEPESLPLFKVPLDRRVVAHRIVESLPTLADAQLATLNSLISLFEETASEKEAR